MTNDIRELNMDELTIVSGGSFAGINALISVTQQKVDNANEGAMAGASKQKAG